MHLGLVFPVTACIITIIETQQLTGANKMNLPKPFFTAADNLGKHSYFKTLADAEAFQKINGGYILETSPKTIWRVTKRA